MWSRTRAVLTAAILGSQALTGCVSWQAATVSPEQLIAQHHPRWIRVRSADGATTTVVGTPSLVSDTLVGRVRGQAVRLPLATLGEVAVQRFSGPRTVLFIVSLPVAFIGGVLIACGASNSCDFGY